MFPERELPWRSTDSFRVRGFNVIVSKRDDLGSGLVSNLNPQELRELADKLSR